MHISRLTIAAFAAGAVTLSVYAPAPAAGRDADSDGMADRWELIRGLDPDDAADAEADDDADGLVNLDEFRQGGRPFDEDTDNDGLDDGDERPLDSRVNDRDSDDDLRVDGHEDADTDGIANEDEDDALESCEADDDDLDGDDVDDEDENELRLRVGDADADDDGITDGEEDRDRDGEANEDEDDAESDECDTDADEDDDDRLGTIVGYDETTARLTVNTFAGGTMSFVLTEDTEIKVKEVEDSDGSDDQRLSTGDLQPGLVVAELQRDDETRAVKEIKVYVA